MIRRMAGVLFAAALLAQEGAIAPGHWAGDYSGQNGGGRINVRLAGEGDKVSSAVVTFTWQGEEVKTDIREFKLAGQNLEITYDFNLAGARLRSAIKGTRTEKDKLKGTYRTTVVDEGSEVDNGTWEATLRTGA